MSRLLAGLALAAALAGCSSGSEPAAAPSPTPAPTTTVAPKPPAELLAGTRTALASATSVHVKGGGEDEEGKFTIEARLEGSKAGRGTLTVDGSPVEVLRIGKKAYFKASAEFWREVAGADAATVAVLVGKYVSVDPSDPDVKELVSITDPAEFGSEFLTAKGAVTKADVRTIGGTEAQGLRFTDTEGDATTVYVATSGPAYPLSLVSKSVTLTFDQYGAPLTVKPPPASQVIEIPSR